MSNYSQKMVKVMTAQENWDYAKAEAFASDNNLSTRSVIAKVKSLGLDYTPKPKAESATPRVRKADVVGAIALALEIPVDTIAGLAKADASALGNLLVATKGWE